MRWLRALYLSNGLAYGILYSFIPVLLEAKSFNPALIGLTTSLGSLAYTFALPAWGHIGDIVSGPRRTLQVACVPAAIFALGLSAPLPVFAVIGCQLILSAGGGPAPALTDAMVLPTLEDASAEYSRLRLLSSLSAAGGAIGGGIVYSFAGYLAAPILYVGVMAATIVSAQYVRIGRDSERQRRARALLDGRVPAPTTRGRLGSVGEAFRMKPRLLAVLASATLGFIGVMAAATYVGLHVADLGGGPLEVGLVTGVGCSAEVPGLILAGWLIPRFGTRPVLAASAAGFAACMVSWVVFTDAGAILVTRLASGIFFSGLMVSYVLTISGMLPERLQATGQTLLQAACFGVAAIAANLLGGILYGAVGPIGVFGGGALCLVAGGALGLFAVRDDDRQKLEPAVPASVMLAR
ncbi:MAG: MFS transporter [Candidatus Limnocylindrales bacterium]